MAFAHNQSLGIFQKRFLEILGIQVEGMSMLQQREIVEMVDSHLQKVILETVISELDGKQFKEFEKSLEDSATMEDQVALLAADIPDLQHKIEAAVEREIEIIKAARKNIF